LLAIRRPGKRFGSTPRWASAAEDVLDGEFVSWNLRQKKGSTGEQEERYDRKIATLHVSSMTFLKRSSLALRDFRQEKTLVAEKEPDPHERDNRNGNPYAKVKVMTWTKRQRKSTLPKHCCQRTVLFEDEVRQLLVEQSYPQAQHQTCDFEEH
jgi:hypothetical protein